MQAFQDSQNGKIRLTYEGQVDPTELRPQVHLKRSAKFQQKNTVPAHDQLG